MVTEIDIDALKISEKIKKKMRLKIGTKLKTSSLNSRLIGFKKE